MDWRPDILHRDIPYDRPRGLGLERRTDRENGHEHNKISAKSHGWQAAAPHEITGDRPNSQCMAEREEKVKLRFQARLG